MQLPEKLGALEFVRAELEHRELVGKAKQQLQECLDTLTGGGEQNPNPELLKKILKVRVYSQTLARRTQTSTRSFLSFVLLSFVLSISSFFHSLFLLSNQRTFKYKYLSHPHKYTRNRTDHSTASRLLLE